MTAKNIAPYQRMLARADREGVTYLGKTYDGRHYKVRGSHGTIYLIDCATLTCHCQAHAKDRPDNMEDWVHCSHQSVCIRAMREATRRQRELQARVDADEVQREMAIIQRNDIGPTLWRGA